MYKSRREYGFEKWYKDLESKGYNEIGTKLGLKRCGIY